MGGFGNFNKGEKKKKRKKGDTQVISTQMQSGSTAPVLVLPKRIEKKQKEY